MSDNIYHATVGESYSWNGDTFDIACYVVRQVDDARAKEITNHFKCDMSDFRKWLEERNKPVRTNADRIRAMTDEELAKFIVDIDRAAFRFHGRDYTDEVAEHNAQMHLLWLKEEVEE